jgi:putative ABC transport system permease protein
MTIKLALRNILRNGRRSAITLTVIVFGAVGLILFGGYKTRTFFALRESTIHGRLGHMQVFKEGYAKSQSQKPLDHGIEDASAIRKEIERDPRVKMTAAQITLMGLVSNGEKSETFIATAVEPAKDHEMNNQRITTGTDLTDNESDAVMVGKGLAESMHVKPGDYLTIMSTTTSGSLNAMDVRVAGIFMTGVKEFDERALKMPIAGAQQLLQTHKIEKLLVFLQNTDDTSAVHSAIASRVHGIEIKEW